MCRFYDYLLLSNKLFLDVQYLLLSNVIRFSIIFYMNALWKPGGLCRHSVVRCESGHYYDKKNGGAIYIETGWGGCTIFIFFLIIRHTILIVNLFIW